MVLSADQCTSYAETGVLVLPGLVDRRTCETLRERMAQLVDAADLDGPTGVFSATNRTQDDDSYFLDSGDDIRKAET